MVESRKLAAILAADVVGFSRLAGADEERTLARLRALRSDLSIPASPAITGGWSSAPGTARSSSFAARSRRYAAPSISRRRMIERNLGAPGDSRIEFRIGVHVGDVVEEEDGDLMGDGVNIAARLEGVARPNGISLSEDAYRQVRARSRPGSTISARRP